MLWMLSIVDIAFLFGQVGQNQLHRNLNIVDAAALYATKSKICVFLSEFLFVQSMLIYLDIVLFNFCSFFDTPPLFCVFC